MTTCYIAKLFVSNIMCQHPFVVLTPDVVDRVSTSHIRQQAVREAVAVMFVLRSQIHWWNYLLGEIRIQRSVASLSLGALYVSVFSSFCVHSFIFMGIDTI